MIKRILTYLIIGILSCGIFVSAIACNQALKPDEIEAEIDTPIADVIKPPADAVKMPQAPAAHEYEPGVAPYIGDYGTTTEAYQLEEVVNENEEVVGVKVSYPASGTELKDWNFVYFDVINYSSEYKYLRLDINEVLSAEKLAVAVYYSEQEQNKYPQVGVMAESLVDGDNAFVVDLSLFKTIDSKYQTTSDNLYEKNISRIYLYFDTVSAQNPGDKKGEAVVSSIMFLKEGDENLNIDKTPYVSDVYVPDVYSEVADYDGVFKVDYNTQNEDMLWQKVDINIKKWSNAYGILRLTFKATEVECMSIYTSDALIAMNGTSMYCYAPTGEEETFEFDFRKAGGLSGLSFYLDSQGTSTQNDVQRSFELINVEFVETVFVDDDWSATGNFNVSDAAVGGKVKASYDSAVGWNALSVSVKNWNTAYKRAIVTLKGDAERIGIAADSTVLYPVVDNPLSKYPYDETTKEYTIEVDLSTIVKLKTLTFYFDSTNVEPFEGVRNIEFVSIVFDKGAPVIGDMFDWGAYTITPLEEGGKCTISWDQRADNTAITILSVSNWTEQYTKFVLKLSSPNAVKLAVYQGWANALQTHTDYEAGENTITVNVTGINSSEFDLYFFWDYSQNTTNTVTIIDYYFTK